jgi:hypothetical protein
MGLKRLTPEEVFETRVTERQKHAYELIDAATMLNDEQKEELRERVLKMPLTTPADEMVRTLITQYEARNTSSTPVENYPTVAITPQGERLHAFMSRPAPWRSTHPPATWEQLRKPHPPGQFSGETVVPPPVVIDTIGSMNGPTKFVGALESEMRQLERTSPEQEMTHLKEDIARVPSLDALSALFIDDKQYAFTVVGGKDQYLYGREIKQLIADVQKSNSADIIPDYFPELKQRVLQLLDQPSSGDLKEKPNEVSTSTIKEEVDVPVSVIERDHDAFDRISAAYTRQTGGVLDDTAGNRNLADVLANDGKTSDTQIIAALLTQNKEATTETEDAKKPDWQKEHADLVPLLQAQEIKYLDDASVEERGKWIKGYKAGLLYKGRNNDAPVIPSPDPASEATVESVEDWDTFKNSFSEKIKKAETAEALYALIYRVEGGFTDPDTGNFALSADELNNLIYGYFKGDSEIKLADIPYMFREAVQRIAENNGYTPARRMQLESESADEEKGEAEDDPFTAPEVSPLVTENLQKQLEKAKQCMLSAQGEYHDAILAHRRLRKLRKGNSDPVSAAQEAEKKEAYLTALATYTKLLTEAEIASYRAEHVGCVRWKSLTQDQLDRFSMRLSADVTPRNEDGSIRDEIIDEQTYTGILTDTEIATLKAQKEFPDAEQAIKARLFTQQFCEDYDRKVDLHIEDGTRNTYEKFIQWWGTLSKGEKVMYGSIAFLSTTALSLFSAKMLAIGGLGVLGKTVFGGVVGAVKGGVFGSMRGARKAYEADQKIQQQTRDSITKYLYQWNQAPTHPKGYQKIMDTLSESDARRVSSQVTILESVVAKGIATGAVLGASAAAILAWFTADIPSVAQPSTSGTVSSLAPLDTTVSVVPGVSFEPVTDELVSLSEPVPTASEAVISVSQAVESFSLRAPDATTLNVFQEMHDTPYDSSVALDRFKMGIIQMLTDKGQMGMSDELRVPSPALDDFFEQVAGGKNNVDGWRNVANTLRNNYGQLDRGPQFIRSLFNG